MRFTQLLTYYEIDLLDKFGKFSLKNPKIIICRWEKRRRFIRFTLKDEFFAESTIYTPQALMVGSYVILGDYRILTDKTRYQIKRVEEVPSLSGKRFVYSSYL